MKNIISFFILACIVMLNACDPLKDYQDQYDSFNNKLKVKFPDSTTVYTLIPSDYQKSSVSNISTNKDFSDASPAITYLPEILNNGYNAKIGALMTINYSFYNPLILKDSVTYSLADGEYGNTYNNYSKISDVYGYLVKNYPLATRGKTVILTYKWFANSVTTSVTNTFVYLGSAWIQIYKLASADYTTMGQSYADFSTATDAQFYIPIFFKNNPAYAYAKSGDNIVIQYVLYTSGKNSQMIMPLTYNGSAWTVVSTIFPGSQKVFFDGTVWRCTPTFSVTTETATRKYTLTDADYTLVGNGQYKDFDTRSTGPEGNINVVLNKIGTILLTRFPEIMTGDPVIFAVTYTNYNGTSGPATINVKVTPQ